MADWPGHLPGQHVDVRLTAEDGYQAEREYSLAAADPGAPAPANSTGGDSDLIELTVQRVPDGEVSPYLIDGLAEGDPVESAARWAGGSSGTRPTPLRCCWLPVGRASCR